jgi:hypothetical protein
MSDWISANWLWLLLGIGLVWFLFRRAGMGCGMGGHSHDSAPSHDEQVTPHAGHTTGTGVAQEPTAPASAPPRRHGGCC